MNIIRRPITRCQHTNDAPKVARIIKTWGTGYLHFDEEIAYDGFHTSKITVKLRERKESSSDSEPVNYSHHDSLSDPRMIANVAHPLLSSHAFITYVKHKLVIRILNLWRCWFETPLVWFLIL